MKIDWRQAEARDAEILSTDGDSCTVRLGAGGGGISLPQIKGTKERYLTGDVEVLEEHSTAMMFRCFLPGQEKENLFMRFGILRSSKRESAWIWICWITGQYLRTVRRAR